MSPALPCSTFIRFPGPASQWTSWLPWRGILCAAAAAVLQTCWAPLDIPRTMRPQTVVLFATPKMLSDFANPEAGVARFLDNYLPLTSRAYQTIVIFAVGNGDHILTYRGMEYWGDTVEWARYTDGEYVITVSH